MKKTLADQLHPRWRKEQKRHWTPPLVYRTNTSGREFTIHGSPHRTILLDGFIRLGNSPKASYVFGVISEPGRKRLPAILRMDKLHGMNVKLFNKMTSDGSENKALGEIDERV